MDKIEIFGGKPLKGSISISGSKNSALPILAATLLADEEFLVGNIPFLSDINSMINLLRSLNTEIRFDSQKCYIKSGNPTLLIGSYELVRKMRASFLILGPLLAKFGYAEVSLPGGCAIGSRPVNLHIEGLEKMGVKFLVEDGYVKGKVKGKLKGARIKLNNVSVGATENLMMAACLASGETIIENAAREPEVKDLARFLIKMGAQIKGHGTKKIVINGQKKLNGCKYNIMPDRIEAGTFALSVLGCSGKIVLENVSSEISNHLIKIFSPIQELKIKKCLDNSCINISRSIKKISSINFKTSPYPGFPTDLQAQLTAAMIKSVGTSIIKENIFENRFMHISELKRMGADLFLDGSSVIIKGKKNVFGAEVMATDLRASSCLIIAGLMANGKTTINRVYHLDRGYENIEKKLSNCNATIKRVKKK